MRYSLKLRIVIWAVALEIMLHPILVVMPTAHAAEGPPPSQVQSEVVERSDDPPPDPEDEPLTVTIPLPPEPTEPDESLLAPSETASATEAATETDEEPIEPVWGENRQHIHHEEGEPSGQVKPSGRAVLLSAEPLMGMLAIQPDAIIDNGIVQLGVNQEGNLIVGGGSQSSGSRTTYVGLRYMPTNADSTSPGCHCEGWGVGDFISKFSGWASIDNGGIRNVVRELFEADGEIATSQVKVGNTFRVTHLFHPSASANLYQVDVTITNISSADVELRYRRVMDWDIEPTYFDEYVTIQTNNVPEIAYTSNDGFATSNPLATPTHLGFTGSFTDKGPDDHGALFDFNFGKLPAGQTKKFTIFYGAAGNEKDALKALETVGAEVYSMGQASAPYDPTLGTPNTFVFAFRVPPNLPTEVGGVQEPLVDNYKPETRGYAGHIDTGNGNLTFRDVDLTLETTAGPIYFERVYTTFNAYYNHGASGYSRGVGPDCITEDGTQLEECEADFSFNIGGGSLGHGWLHTYETSIALCSPLSPISMSVMCGGLLDGSILMVTPGGERFLFRRQADGAYKTDRSANGTLRLFDNGTPFASDDTVVYTNTTGHELTYAYDTGQLLEINFQRGSTIKLNYEFFEGLDVLDKVYDSGDPSRFMSFSYCHATYAESLIRLCGIELSDGRAVSFDYLDSWGNLTDVTDVHDKRWRYCYAGAPGEELCPHEDPHFTDEEMEDYPYLHYFMTGRLYPGATEDGGPPIVEYHYRLRDEDKLGRPRAMAFRAVNGAGETVFTINPGTGGDTPTPTVIHYGNTVPGTAPDDPDPEYVGHSISHLYTDSNKLALEQLLGLPTGEETISWDYGPQTFKPIVVTDALDRTTQLNWTSDGGTLILNRNPLTTTHAFVSEILGLNLAEYLYTPYYNDRTPTYVVTKLVYNTPTVASPTNYRLSCTTAGVSCLLPSETASSRRTNTLYNAALPKHLLLQRIDNYRGTGTGVVTSFFYYVEAGKRGLLKAVDTPVPYSDTLYRYDDTDNPGSPSEVIEKCEYSPTAGTCAGGLSTRVDYDEFGRIFQVIDPSDRITEYAYHGESDLVRLKIENRNPAFPYSAEDGDDTWNIATAYAYDDAGRVTQVTENAGSLVIDPTRPELNRITEIRYDAAGRVYETITNRNPNKAYGTDGYNSSTRTLFDGAGRISAVIENYIPASQPFGNPTAVPTEVDFDGDGQFDRDVDGELFRIAVDPNLPDINHITVYRYNSVGRVEQTIAPAWPREFFGANPLMYKIVNNRFGQQITYNLVSAFQYDAVGNVILTIANFDRNQPVDGNSFSMQYQPEPTEAAFAVSIDPDVTDRNQVTCTTYDELNRPKMIRNACIGESYADYTRRGTSLYNVVAVLLYDPSGRNIFTVENYQAPREVTPGTQTLTVTAEYNHVTRTFFDALGRTEWVVRNYVGNALGSTPPTCNLLAPPDVNLISRFYYDSAGRLIATVENYCDLNNDTVLTQPEIETGLDYGFNFVTRYYYDAGNGQINKTVANFAGDILTGIHPAFQAGNPDVNLVTLYENFDDLNRPQTSILSRDSLGRIVNTQAFDNLDRVTHSAFDAEGLNLETDFHFGRLGFVSTMTDPERRESQIRYDVAGNSQTIMDPNGLALTTVTVFDRAGRPIEGTVSGTSETVRLTYDPFGNVLRIVRDPGGLALTTNFTYNLFGQLLSMTEERGVGLTVKTAYVYNNLGQLVQVVENANQANTGTPSCVTFDLGTPAVADVCTQYTYDDIGNLTRITLGNETTRQYQYDKLGQLSFEVSDPSGEALFTEHCFDAAGNLIRTLRGRGRTQAGLCTNPGLFPAALLTTYTYDALGHVTNIDYAGSTQDVAYTFDAFGFRQTMIEKSSDGVPVNTWRYQTDHRGLITNVCSDSISETTCAGYQVSYGYDDTGNLETLTYPGQSLTYAYDRVGRLERVTSGAERLALYEYDRASRVTDAFLPNNLRMDYNYDRAGRLDHIRNTGAGGAPAALLSEYRYTLDPRGNRTGAAETLATSTQSTSGNPVAENDLQALLTALLEALNNGSIKNNGTYNSLRAKVTGALDALQRGNTTAAINKLEALKNELNAQKGKGVSAATVDMLLTLINETINHINNPPPASIAYNWQYRYDARGRLVNACTRWNPTAQTCVGTSFAYEYDGAGNLILFSYLNWSSQQVQIVRYLYNGANQVRCIDANNDQACDTAPWQYDNYGNLISDGQNTYTYDTAQRLILVQNAQGTTSYEYNGDGDRTAQVHNGVRTEYVLDVVAPLTNVLVENTGGTPTRYLYGLGMIGQQRGSNPTEFLFADGLGSIRQVVRNGRVTTIETFDPYGNRYSEYLDTGVADASRPSFGFTGQQQDKNGLTYLRARYYNSSIGLFTQPDPFDGAIQIPASMNPYGYVHGNPVNLTDPSGQIVPIVAALLLIGGLALAGGIAGGGFEIAYQLITEGEVTNWKMVGMRAAEGAILGGLTGLVLATAGLAAPGVATATVATVGGVNITAGAVASFAVDIAIGAAWDMSVHGDDPGRAIATNLAGEVLGEGIGEGASHLMKRFARSFARNAGGEVVDAAANAARRADIVGATCKRNSFSAETPVATENGDKPISEVEIGDEVLAYNEATGAVGAYTVTDTFSHTDEVIIELTIDGETIETTPEHPFFTDEGEWKNAEDIYAGERIRSEDGDYGTVTGTRVIDDANQRMYNLTVDEAHTFFVGEGEWLVHNCTNVAPIGGDPHNGVLVSHFTSREYAERYMKQAQIDAHSIDGHVFVMMGLSSPNEVKRAGAFFADARISFYVNPNKLEFDPEIKYRQEARLRGEVVEPPVHGARMFRDRGHISLVGTSPTITYFPKSPTARLADWFRRLLGR